MMMNMGLRLELFVADMEASIAFYRRAPGFEPVRRESDYASVRSGNVTFGLGPIAKLPTEGGYFTGARMAGDRGAGVEIVLEVDDVAAYRWRMEASGYPVLDALRARPV